MYATSSGIIDRSRRLRRFAAIVLLGLAAAAAPAAGPAPRLDCDQPVFNFGRVPPDTPDLRHTFVLKNTGTVSLRIQDIGQECGCTDIVLSHKLIAPGGESRLSATFSVQGREGRVRKFLYVYSTDPERPKFALSFEGEVEPEVVFEPAGVLFGAVSRDTAVRREVTVRFARGREDEIVKVESSHPAFAADLAIVETGRCYRVTVHTVPPMAGVQSFARGAIRLHTQRRRPVPLEFAVSALAAAEVLVAPDVLLVPASGTEPVTRYATLRPGSAPPFRILAVEPPDPSLKTTVRPAPGGGWQIRIDGVRPGRALAGKILRIRTDLPERAVFEIPFQVDAAPGP